MSDIDPTLRPEPLPEDGDRALRPQTLEAFIGQAEARANLRVFIESAKMRKDAMDHVLFHGPPGLGKTTLAQIMARELGVGFRMTSGPVLARAGDLAAILTNLEPNDVLFIDEIHRLNPAVEEVLYPALEDFALDLVIGEGPAARTVRIELQPFTLVGATTRMGLLTTPLRDRFGIVARLEFYTPEELALIVRRSAGLLKVETDETGGFEIARRSRGTPRIANRLLRRVRDYAEVKGDGRITEEIAHKALAMLDDICEQQLKQLSRAQPPQWLKDCKRSIAEQLHNGTPDLSHVAQKLEVSPRKLRRLLAEQELSFLQLIDELRAAGQIDLSMITAANRQIRAMVGG